MNGRGTDLEFISDGEGLIVFGDDESLSELSRIKGISASSVSPQVMHRARDLFSAVGVMQANSGRYVKLSDESAKLMKKRVSEGPIRGAFRRGDLDLPGNSGQFFKQIEIEDVLTLSPAVATAGSALAAQAAIEAALAEIKEYLEVIDEKLDELLRQSKIENLGQLGGIQYEIEEADELYRSSNSVSKTTWSKVNGFGGALSTIEASALEHLADVTRKLEEIQGDSKKVAAILNRLDDELPFWLGILARAIYLHDRLYVIEIAHVSEFEPQHLAAHRAAIENARHKRVEATTQRLLAIRAAVRSSAALSNLVWMSYHSRAHQITMAANKAEEAIGAFAEHVQLTVDSEDQLQTKGWRESVVAWAGDTIEAANRARQSGVERAQKTTEKFRTRSDDRVLAKAAEIERKRAERTDPQRDTGGEASINTLELNAPQSEPVSDTDTAAPKNLPFRRRKDRDGK
ncbi:hypothetical protein [Corynebacterium sp. CCUG 70398]|uniref:hypothetical protein n=1 Tax=Corynebacterium sp. CCUG 70398 TaxID=2823891 RepID=UPI00210D04F2|nr:hypothetical protein [Corynebacterium sp. CCUG 70398]MCQ4621804.1 hypothetical protein [Corynebacterium sp. CCUG 70398]